jgi:hypothetical protein
MYVTTNSALVWKRVADENQQSVRLLARVSIGLLLLSLAAGAYAYSAQSQLDSLCSSIARETRSAQSPGARQLGTDISDAYCG